MSIVTISKVVAQNYDISAGLSERLTKAACTISFGEDLCSPAKNSIAKTFLNFARFFAPETQSIEHYNDKDEINFSWGDSDYQLLCGGGWCRIARQIPTTRANTVLAGAANFVTLFLAGCEDASNKEKNKSEDVGQFDDSTLTFETKPKGWVFCAKSGLVDPTDDCHLNKNITDKISTCVYLTGIIASSADHNEDIEYDHDKLMSFLLSYNDYPYYRFCFDGNNEWPEGFFENSCMITNANATNSAWMGYDANFKVHLNKDTWSVQAWFRQPPDLCWAVYETPCADESVCE